MKMFGFFISSLLMSGLANAAHLDTGYAIQAVCKANMGGQPAVIKLFIDVTQKVCSKPKGPVRALIVGSSSNEASDTYTSAFSATVSLVEKTNSRIVTSKVVTDDKKGLMITTITLPEYGSANRVKGTYSIVTTGPGATLDDQINTEITCDFVSDCGN